MKKKILLCLLAMVVCLTLVGCGKKENSDNNKSGGSSSSSSSVEIDAQDGILTQMVDEDGNPREEDFIMNGLILVGNRHSYSGLEAGDEGIAEKLVKEGFKKTGINSTFYLNEYIEFYMDTTYEGKEEDVRILVVPNTDMKELDKMKHDDLEVLASEKGFVTNYVTPDKENNNYVNEGYVSMDYPEGKYIVLFMYKNKIAYHITLDLVKEPIE